QDAFMTADDTTVHQVDQVQSTRNLTTKGSNSGPHIPTTNQLKKVKSNCRENSESVTDIAKITVPDRVDIEQDKGDEVITHKKKTEIHIDIRTILRTCPEFATWSENIGHCVNN